MLRRVVAFVVAVAVMVVLGSASHSYFVQEAWSATAGQAGGTGSVAIPFGERASWAGHDLVGMIVPYSFIISIALCIAFLAAGALARFTGRRMIVYGVAGALAIYATFTALKLLLGSVGIFGARGAFGLAAQMLVGLVAGVLFAQLTAPRESQRTVSGVI
jgi:hypothetical protein